MSDEAKGYFALSALLFIWFVPFLLIFFGTTRKLWSKSEKKISLRELRVHSFTLFGFGKGWTGPNEREALGTPDDDLVYLCRTRIYRFRWVWGLSGFVVYWTILRIF